MRAVDGLSGVVVLAWVALSSSVEGDRRCADYAAAEVAAVAPQVSTTAAPAQADRLPACRTSSSRRTSDRRRWSRHVQRCRLHRRCYCWHRARRDRYVRSAIRSGRARPQFRPGGRGFRTTASLAVQRSTTRRLGGSGGRNKPLKKITTACDLPSLPHWGIVGAR